jgi:hypothetical protein
VDLFACEVLLRHGFATPRRAKNMEDSTAVRSEDLLLGYTVAS